MSEPFDSELVICPMCRERVDADLIMDSTGLCCDCDPENQANCKGDEMNDREGDR